jgi:hypothetical protein
MEFNLARAQDGLPAPPCSIWDAHLHIWDADGFPAYERWAGAFGVTRYLGIAAPEVKRLLEQRGKAENIVFALYLPMDAFAHHDARTLLSAVEEARKSNYAMVKMWFGPRFLDFANAQRSFDLSLPEFDGVFSRIEDYALPIDIHVADPDVWYARKYRDAGRYRSKRRAIDEFATVLERHPGLRVISVHFGSLPEPENLPLLSSLLDNHPNLCIDTASTKWMIRELGRAPGEARDFIIKHQRRILFASDLSVGTDEGADYYATRYWAQRLFWETDVRDVPLPFPDDDSENQATVIRGLNLPRGVLENLYWRNANEFFGVSL